MAIVNFYGFEMGDTGFLEFQSVNGSAAYSTTTFRTGARALRVNTTGIALANVSLGRYGADGTRISLSTSSIANFFLTFYFRYAVKTVTTPEEIMSASGGSINVRLDPTGVLLLYNNITLVDTGTIVLDQNTWYRIDVNYDDTANTQEVRINGVVDLTGTIATGGAFTSITVGKTINRSGEDIDFFYDDMVLSDSAYIGTAEVRMGKPIGAGAVEEWGNGTGTTFAEVDDAVPFDGDTSYIGASALEDNEASTFDMETAATMGIVGSILAVKTIGIARSESTAGTSSVSHRRRINGVNYTLTAVERPTTYNITAAIDEDDTPGAGGSAWTTTSFDSIEVGIVSATLAQIQRATAFYVMSLADGVVSFDPAASRISQIMNAPVQRKVRVVAY
jgi:hypothetical protein